MGGDGEGEGTGLGGLLPKTEMERSDRWLEIISAILLALATTAIAWSGYQATRWGGVQANSYASGNADRTESIRLSGRADTLTSIDVSLFTEWVDARAGGDQLQADFYEERFRDEFTPAFEEWVALDPLGNPDAPKSPFALESYVLTQEVQAEELSASADRKSETARQANQRGDNYVLVAVLFATVLFFAGISTKFESRRLRAGGLVMALVILVAAFSWMLTMPVSFGV